MQRTNNNKKMNSNYIKKLKKAERNLNKILEEIKPFIKERKIKYCSTNGKWEAITNES